MRVALVSTGHGPSLALRNLRTYCLAHEDVARSAEFTLFDRDLRRDGPAARHARAISVRRWAFASGGDELLARLCALEPDVVGFSCYLWSTELSVLVARQLKRLRPDVRIVLGGPDVGPRAAELLGAFPEIDCVVQGDGERPFLEIVRRHIAGAPSYAGIPGVCPRTASGVRSEPATGLTDLALLQKVYEPMTSAQVERWGWPHLLYETMRGCPYECSYCMYGKVPPNRKDPAVVVDELHALLARGLPVEIIDPTFTTYAPRAKQILRALGERSYDGGMMVQAYPDSLDDEMIELLERARVEGVGLGFQTMSAEGLDAVARPANLQRFERAVSLLKRSRVHFYVDVIYGLPATTRADFTATMDYLHRLGVDRIVVYRLLGLPGSPMMNDIERYGLVFSPTPPYELLSSRTFSIEDVVYCERYCEAYERMSELGPELVRRFANVTGGLTAFLERVMESGALDRGDKAELQVVLAKLMLGPVTTRAS